ncbi:multicopper oxidase domain-containing protein [Dankookia sp. P2]|uniref:multicopper oxidase domain-containing protein n=1 Tax=Dankookia sp. P2 TaxID=3423955 RepID=UPI003D6756BB
MVHPGLCRNRPCVSTEVYSYPNDQPAATLWYHDHALGLTRIHMDSGLSGMLLLRDATGQSLVRDGVLPDAAAELPLILQDRAFTADGQLYMPSAPGDPIPGKEGTVADDLPPDYAGRCRPSCRSSSATCRW